MICQHTQVTVISDTEGRCDLCQGQVKIKTVAVERPNGEDGKFHSVIPSERAA